LATLLLFGEAAQLAISKRSIVSWEQPALRFPSFGMVVLLHDALFPGEELSFQRELITAYIVDDLEHQEERRDSQPGEGEPLLHRIQRVIAHVLQAPTSSMQVKSSRAYQEALEQVGERMEDKEVTPSQEKGDEQQALEPLFALIEQLRKHPELISVTSAFLHELTPEE